MRLINFSPEHSLLLFISFAVMLASLIVFERKHVRTSLVLLTACALCLGFCMATLDPFLNLWDEGFHALVAKNMTLHPLKPTLFEDPVLPYDYRGWTGNHVWLHKQPLFLWQMALSIKLFGANELAVRLPAVIMHALLPLVIYRIGRIILSARTGFYGAVLFTCSYFTLELITGRAITEHNDSAFLFYITLSLWAWFEFRHSEKKKWLVLIGLFSGCAILVKWLVGLLVFGVWGIYAFIDMYGNGFRWQVFRQMALSFGICVLVALPWQLFILHTYPEESRYEYEFNTRHFSEVIEGHAGDALYHLRVMSEVYENSVGRRIKFYTRNPILHGLLLMSGLVVLTWRIPDRRFKWAPLIAVLMVYLFYSLAATKMNAFCFIVSPFIFLGIASLPEWPVKKWTGSARESWLPNIVSAVIVALVAYSFINLKRINEQHTIQPNDEMYGRKQHLDLMQQMVSWKEYIGDRKVFLFSGDVKFLFNIPIMFYTGCTAKDRWPTEEEIDIITAKGYEVIVLDNQKLPEYLLQNPKITRLPVRST